MPTKKNRPKQTIEALRHAEYYGQQDLYDQLYADSKEGKIFENLVPLILSRENILLAYRNIKTNKGSQTAGTDGLTISDIGRLNPEVVVNKIRYIVQGSKHGYRPKPVRRKEIPKPNGKTRPLGIPCIWDRLIQQCVKQVLEPICEAKFSENSYGFRPERSVENAIGRLESLIFQSKLHYVVEVDIKGFFDNVNHSKLIRQMWALGIRDKHLIYLIRQMLKAPIKMPTGQIIIPEKGTPQGGILSPLLANIVLNELDHWIESQWEENPLVYKYHVGVNPNGGLRKSGYRAMRKTGLKEMFIVRYADDFRILCRYKDTAERAKHATIQWLQNRLKLEVAEEKTKVVNIRKQYTDFLGLKIKTYNKNGKWVIRSRIGDKALRSISEKIGKQAKRIAKPRPIHGEAGEIFLYNSMVMGIHNFYKIATMVNIDLNRINWKVMTILTNRLGHRLKREGRALTPAERMGYGKSKMLRFVAGTGHPIYPIGYIRHIHPFSKKRTINRYTREGRQEIHENLSVNTALLRQLMRQPNYNETAEYVDNRLSLFSAQQGKCAITGKTFVTTEEIHCHHKIPRENGGSDEYNNLILVLNYAHKLIHAKEKEVISEYSAVLNLTKEQKTKLNNLRVLTGNEEI